MQTTRRRLPPEIRRLEIVEAAERLLSAHGDRVRAEDVALEAKTAKGTFFHYFPVWDDLLDALRARTFARFAERYAPPEPGAPKSAWRETLPELVHAFVEFTLAQAGLHDVLFHSDFARRRPAAFEAGAVGQLEQIISAGQDAGAFARTDPRLTARFVFAVMHEAADLVAGGGDRVRASEAAAHMLRRALLSGDEP